MRDGSQGTAFLYFEKWVLTFKKKHLYYTYKHMNSYSYKADGVQTGTPKGKEGDYGVK